MNLKCLTVIICFIYSAAHGEEDGEDGFHYRVGVGRADVTGPAAEVNMVSNVKIKLN